MHLATYFTGGASILASLAAVFWISSAAIDVPAPARIGQVVVALRRAARLNRIAALLTGLSTLSGVVGLLLTGH